MYQNLHEQAQIIFSVLFFSRPRFEGWPNHGRTFSICSCSLSFWLTLPRRVLSRPCVAFLACVHLARLALFLALSLSPGTAVSLWHQLATYIPRTYSDQWRHFSQSLGAHHPRNDAAASFSVRRDDGLCWRYKFCIALHSPMHNYTWLFW